jgi:hypothetical protein
MGRDYKRYEHEKVRNGEIIKSNKRLIQKMEEISRQEHYPKVPPARPFTLQGKWQKEQMARITYENHKLLEAVEERPPTMKYGDMLRHNRDHRYQVTKMSEYQKTVPMSEIIRDELRANRQSRPQTTYSYAGSVASRRSQTSSKAGSRTKPEEVEQVRPSEPFKEQPVEPRPVEPVAPAPPVGPVEEASDEEVPGDSEPPPNLEADGIKEAGEELVGGLEEEDE